MSTKTKRGWFVCPQWAALVSGHYASDAEAARAPKMDPKVLARPGSRTPVAKSTVLRAFAHLPADTMSVRQPPTSLPTSVSAWP
jgi:hypothetical protein